jgi:hypothetical protein
MRRRLLTISTLAVAHFIISFALGVLYLVLVPSKMRLDAALSDHLIGWPLVILQFPVRNLANWLEGYSDMWLYERSGFLVLGASSILWAITVHAGTVWLKVNRRAA